MDKTMKRMYLKLLAVVLSVMIIIGVIVSVSYAWVTLSTSPSVSGARLTVSGGTTILLAADMQETVDDNGVQTVVHYPAAFSSELEFSEHTGYDYMSGLSGLTPVSTADGVSWILPVYDQATGELKDISEFEVDRSLSYANITDAHQKGRYVYLDFWAVSPGSDYELRVSMDVKTNEGSSLVEIPGAVEDGSTVTGFALSSTDNSIASAVRVGFLVNGSSVSSRDTALYARSAGSDERFQSLRGQYKSPGEQADVFNDDKFTIYEPNGLLHYGGTLNQGDYALTSPLGYDATTGTISAADVSDILTVQGSSHWTEAGNERLVDQFFQTRMVGKTGLTAANAPSRFFGDELSWHVQQYISAGTFFSNTNTLYSNATDGVVPASRVASNLLVAGATDSVYITTLERNVPQRIRMFIWIEGQDPDCIAADSDITDFVLYLELAGAN